MENPVVASTGAKKTPSRSERVLHILGLEKRYGNVEALAGLNLEVGSGEVYGFLGRNGAGKSTAIRIIMGITKQNHGSVKLFDDGLIPLDPRARQKIGYVAQEQNFYGWMTPTTIGKFVRGFFPTWDDGEFKRLCKSLELPMSRKIQGFSGGMKAKMALALALAHRPPLLVLDEPMAGLDPVARREFIQLVRDQAETSGRTTFFSSHLVDEVETAADRVGIIEKGQMRFEGPLGFLSDSICLLQHAVTDEPLPVPEVLLTDQDITILHDRVRRNTREIVIWTEHPPHLALVLPFLKKTTWNVKQLHLEDIFIELVSHSVM